MPAAVRKNAANIEFKAINIGYTKINNNNPEQQAARHLYLQHLHFSIIKNN